MFASSRGPRPGARRRGIVLILVLGMLGLMALIGVTFAAFAGQSLKNSRNFGQGAARPQPEALMDFALAQLINDSNNPMSAIRGHSLLRDMYGNDSTYRGSNPARNAVVDLLVGGVFDRVYNAAYGTFQALSLTGAQIHPYSGANVTPFYGQVQYTTNIPTTGQYYGLDFTRWTIRCAPGTAVAQTFEVLEDDFSGAVHKFTLSANLGSPITATSSSDVRSFIYANPNFGLDSTQTPPKAYSALADEGNTFVLDGRYMRAFNGPGLTRPVAAMPSVDANGNTIIQFANYPYNQAAYANMRIANYDPDQIGMDEDYDACDLENWFLAIQSADGQVMIPSFHRPGILTAGDWTDPARDNSGDFINQATRAKILRPRQIDNSPLFPPDPSNPDSVTGKLTYDIDNDGDGVTDSVWLDLGYPTQRDVNGKLSKPLFAFMVLGLNGRLPLNTVGNLQARAIGDTTYNGPTAPGDNVPFPTSSGQVPYAGFYTTSGNHNFAFSSQVFFDSPLHDHASHLGYSVNEINPKFALQNAPSNLFSKALAAPRRPDDGSIAGTYSQVDNAGVSVALTQLRNLLAGGMASDLNSPTSLGVDAAGSLATSVKAITGTSARSASSFNDDINAVTVNDAIYVLPNGMADAYDYDVANNAIHDKVVQVQRAMPPIPGRWGEPEGQPSLVYIPSSYNDADTKFPMLRYANPVRAGRSYFVATATSNDAMDDDFDAFDPVLPRYGEQASAYYAIKDYTAASYNGTVTRQYQLPVNSTATAYPSTTFTRVNPEDLDRFDGAGQAAVASERIRRFVTPIDPAGVGRVVEFMKRPGNDHDYGKGADKFGRTAYFRYFRPAGVPQDIAYGFDPTPGTNYGFGYLTSGSGNGGTPAIASGVGQRYLAPVLIPAGWLAGAPQKATPNVTNNVLHGYQAMATPDTQGSGADDPKAQTIATMGAMPYDWDASFGRIPAGYVSPIPLLSPTIHPGLNSLNSVVNSGTGPNLGGTLGGPGGAYPIPYVPTGDLGQGNYGASPSPAYDTTTLAPVKPMVVNGYIGGSLNKDEADEMNLYTANGHDAPYGATDLEWLYRKHDVDGATLDSRLGKLAPISFLNPADGLTRRRLFSTDAWDLINFSYANDNPVQYAGIMGFVSGGTNPPYSGIHSSDHDFSYNSRFGPDASPSFEIMNQVAYVPNSDPARISTAYANALTTQFLFNPTLPSRTYSADGTGNGDSITSYVQNSAAIDAGLTYPKSIKVAAGATATADPYTGLITPTVTPSAAQVQTPSVAHRDRKINLNFPLPLSADPAEPVRQKWCRETYQMLKAILPPAAVDTPEELAQLSQFVVNIVDFRDPDCTMTRFVNTDLVLTDALTKSLKPPIPSSAKDGFSATEATEMAILNVSPMGVRFAQAGDVLTAGHFPYDPSLYNPDEATPYLVQHGMEYNPIAINETVAVQYQHPNAKGDMALNGTCRALFVELINTLTESENDSNDASGGRSTQTNSSAIDLTGWDLIIAPDNYGWGRPDPITGDVSVFAWPPQRDATFTATPVTDGQKSGNERLPLTKAPVQQYRFTSNGTANPDSNNKVRAFNGSTLGDLSIIGAYSYAAGPDTGKGEDKPPQVDSKDVEHSPIAKLPTGKDGHTTAPDATKPPTIDVVLPKSMIPYADGVTPGSGKGAYFWVYLRRPANPFDTADLVKPRVNREMVVVDAMRFPFIDLGRGSVTDDSKGNVTITQQTDVVFSASRLQPYRGGHLVPRATETFDPVTIPGPGGPTLNTIAPPSPAHAYGYSEQTYPPAAPTATNANYVQYFDGQDGAASQLSKSFRETIGKVNGTNPGNDIDTNWAHFAFHDRDFASVAELLLVPGCPPGLFTKQFVEEPYPGHAVSDGTPAAGWDRSNLDSGTNVPTGDNIGQVDFGYSTKQPVLTFPYLTDNFYYTAASVQPPATPDTNQVRVPAEIGGWTGTGWHKMMEFFEVPSSANGAIGTAEAGNNYDWYRADVKPGQLNLNLIIDEEVFAGLIDDPRINEYLAFNLNGAGTNTPKGQGSTIPFVVSQIDYYGHPKAVSPLFPGDASSQSFNRIANTPTQFPYGRGYVVRDADNVDNPTSQYQQIHGLKAAFSDFLKLRHGGSGHLFAHGAGDVGMGDAGYITISGGVATYTESPYNTQPVAADRPFRSLSYPDINYTIMRPASLPPAPIDTAATPSYLGTFPPLTPTLASLFQYQASTTPPYVQLNPAVAPRAATPVLQYVQDPGIRNPLLDIQYSRTNNANLTAYDDRRLAPPYDVSAYNVAGGHVPPSGDVTYYRAQPAPFPPTIPPTPARRLFQVPDTTIAPTTNAPSSNAGLDGQIDNFGTPALTYYSVNQPTRPFQMSNNLPVNTAGTVPPQGTTTPPSLVRQTRAVFAADNFSTQPPAMAANNFLGAGATGTVTDDLRMHPAYRTEWLQKMMNLSTVRTHQFAVWITVGFFEVIKTGTPELNITDVLGQEVGAAAGNQVRFRSFFVIDRTKATGFNPYYPGNFRDCVTYRRRIE